MTDMTQVWYDESGTIEKKTWDGFIRLADLEPSDISRARVEIKYPPNIDAIDKRFPGVKVDCTRRQIIFTYGNTIYNPSGRQIPIELIVHECVHIKQQTAVGVEYWWAEYLRDKSFRLDQELEAHCVEFEQHEKLYPSRGFRRAYLASCAERLSSPLYGRMLKKKEAQAIIKDRVWNKGGIDGNNA